MIEKERNKFSAKTLRLRYGVSRTTWLVWLRPIRKKIPLNKKIYNPKELQEIYKLLGRPE